MTITDLGAIETPDGTFWRTHVGGDLPDGKILDHNIDIDDIIIQRHGPGRRKVETMIALDDLCNLLKKHEYHAQAEELAKLVKDLRSGESHSH